MAIRNIKNCQNLKKEFKVVGQTKKLFMDILKISLLVWVHVDFHLKQSLLVGILDNLVFGDLECNLWLEYWTASIESCHFWLEYWTTLIFGVHLWLEYWTTLIFSADFTFGWKTGQL